MGRPDPAGRWIRGFGMDYAKYTDPRYPTRWDLDRATRDHPVIAYHVSWSLLCNGVIVFDDLGEILPDGRIVPTHRLVRSRLPVTA